MTRLALALAGVTALLTPAIAAAAPWAGATRLTGPAGCVTAALANDPGTCTAIVGLRGPAAVAVAPDGRNVYAAAGGADGVVALARDAAGGLAPLGCVTQDGSDGVFGTDGACVDGSGLDGAGGVAVSPDGAHVYVTAEQSGAVSTFARDTGGTLTQVECLTSGPATRSCRHSSPLAGASSVLVSADGKNVYVTAAASAAVVAFARDASTGALTQIGCVSNSGHDGACDDGRTLGGAAALAASPDGRHVYVAAAADGAIDTFRRDPSTGALAQARCLLAAPPHKGPCGKAVGLGQPVGIAVSPDGASAYVAASEGLATLRRDPESGVVDGVSCFTEGELPDDADEPAGDEEPAEDDGDEPAGDEEPAEDDPCVPTPGVGIVKAVAVEADGATVLATGDGLTAFRRDSASGALEPLGSSLAGIAGGNALALSPDARNAYLADADGNRLTVLADAAGVTTRAAHARRGRVTVRVACPATSGAPCAGTVELWRRGGGAAASRPASYRIDPGAAARVPLRLGPGARARLRHGHSVRALVVVRHAAGLLAPSRSRILVRRAR